MISRHRFESSGSVVNHSRYFSQVHRVRFYSTFKVLNLLSLNSDQFFQPVEVTSLPFGDILFGAMTLRPLRSSTNVFVYYSRQTTSTCNRPKNSKKHLAHYTDVSLVGCSENSLNAYQDYREIRPSCLSCPSLFQQKNDRYIALMSLASHQMEYLLRGSRSGSQTPA